MLQDPVAVVRRFFEEGWNQRRIDVIDDVLTDESVCYADDGPLVGAQDFKERQYGPFLAAFPDLKVRIDAILCQGEDVVVRWSATGRHSAPGLGFAPTNEIPEFRGISWIKVRDGKFREGWQCTNIPEVLRDLVAKAPR